MSQLRDRIASMVFAFDDADRQDAVRALARDVGAMEARVAELEARIKTITEGCARENLNIEQICGKALGYPRYCDDQKAFPGATEEDGVCVGEHVAASIASELANKYQDLLARCKRLEEAGDAHMEWVPASFQGAWRAAKEAKP